MTIFRVRCEANDYARLDTYFRDHIFRVGDGDWLIPMPDDETPERYERSLQFIIDGSTSIRVVPLKGSGPITAEAQAWLDDWQKRRS